MNLQDYIEQIKGWIVRQCFLIRHYRIVIFIFFILALAMIAAGIFYPHKDEHIDINSAQSEDAIDNQRQVDAKEQSSKRANKKKMVTITENLIKLVWIIRPYMMRKMTLLLKDAYYMM